MTSSTVKQAAKRSIKNPGAVKYDRLYSKRNPTPIQQLDDQELLSMLIGAEAAGSVMERIGGLKNYSSIREGATLLSRPGISKATAVKIDALFEVTCRIG